MICVKCGFEQNLESEAVCAKCGAVQEKVKQALKGQVDSLASLCNGLRKFNLDTIESAETLQSKLNDDTGNIDSGIVTETKQKLEKALDEAEKLAKSLDSLASYILLIKAEFQAADKINKATDYCKSYKTKANRLSVEIGELKNVFSEGGVKKKAVPPSSDFAFQSNPKEHDLYLERINEIESSLAKEKFPALGTMSFIYDMLGKLLGLICFGLIGILLFNSPFAAAQKAAGIAIILVVGAIIVVSIIAIAESIKLGVEIEKNSRATMEYMKVLVEKSVSKR